MPVSERLGHSQPQESTGQKGPGRSPAKQGGREAGAGQGGTEEVKLGEIAKAILSRGDDCVCHPGVRDSSRGAGASRAEDECCLFVLRSISHPLAKCEQLRAQGSWPSGEDGWWPAGGGSTMATQWPNTSVWSFHYDIFPPDTKVSGVHD